MCLKTDNCCLEICVKKHMGEKMCEKMCNII